MTRRIGILGWALVAFAAGVAVMAHKIFGSAAVLRVDTITVLAGLALMGLVLGVRALRADDGAGPAAASTVQSTTDDA